jgi:hypothetical protein
VLEVNASSLQHNVTSIITGHKLKLYSFQMESNKLVNRLDLPVGGLSLCALRHKLITLDTHTKKCHMKVTGTHL